MVRSKQTSKRKSRRRILPIAGAAGVSLAFAGGVSAASAPTTEYMSIPDTTSRPFITLSEEEISDINLGTFYVFDKGNVKFGEPVQVAQRGCRSCRGCAARGCRSCRGCAVVRGCGGRGCGCTTGCRVWRGGVWVWIC